MRVIELRTMSARLRRLLVVMVVAALAMVALGAVSHAHQHRHAHDHPAVTASTAVADEAPAGAGTADLAPETEGVCLAVALVALVLLTVARALLAHRADCSPAAPWPPAADHRQPATPEPGPPDLVELAVCRQ